MQTRWFTLRRDTAVAARLAAIAEPGFVLIAGTLLARVALTGLGSPNADRYLYAAVPDFRAAAAAQFLDLTVRYGLVLLVAIALAFWRGRSSAASYGLTFGNRRFVDLVGVGILLGLLASLPVQILKLASQYVHLGPGTRFWALEARVPWDASFWLYMAVGSYFVVPIFEELFARGYFLGRVRESFSAGGSLLLMSVFFSFAHGQYRHGDALAIGSLVTLLLWATICGYAVYRTGSLVPPLIAHAIINVPMSVDVRWATLAVSLVALVVWRNAFTRWTRDMIATFADVDDWPATALALLAVVLIIVSLGATAWFAFVWLAILGCLSIVLGIRHRSVWAAPST